MGREKRSQLVREGRKLALSTKKVSTMVPIAQCVENYVYECKGHGFDAQGTNIWIKKMIYLTHYMSFYIKVYDKILNVS